LNVQEWGKLAGALTKERAQPYTKDQGQQYLPGVMCNC